MSIANTKPQKCWKETFSIELFVRRDENEKISKLLFNFLLLMCLWMSNERCSSMILIPETRVLVIKDNITSSRWCHFIKFPPFCLPQARQQRTFFSEKREIKFMTATKRKPDIYLDAYYAQHFGKFFEKRSRNRKFHWVMLVVVCK